MKNWMLHPYGAKESSFRPSRLFLFSSGESGARFQQQETTEAKDKDYLTLRMFQDGVAQILAVASISASSLAPSGWKIDAAEEGRKAVAEIGQRPAFG